MKSKLKAPSLFEGVDRNVALNRQSPELSESRVFLLVRERGSGSICPPHTWNECADVRTYVADGLTPSNPMEEVPEMTTFTFPWGIFPGQHEQTWSAQDK